MREVTIFKGEARFLRLRWRFFKDQDNNQLFVDFECTFEDDGGLFNSNFYFFAQAFLLFFSRRLFYSFAELFNKNQ